MAATDPPYSKGEAGLSGHPANHFFQGRGSGGALNGGPALTTSYQKFSFVDPRTGGEFLTAVVTISNDHVANYIDYSLDGVTFDGRVYFGETYTLPQKHIRALWLKGQAGGELYRLTGY